jgi:hypothetical protein
VLNCSAVFGVLWATDVTFHDKVPSFALLGSVRLTFASSQIHSWTSWLPTDFRFDQRFTDVISRNADGSVTLDLSQMSVVEQAPDLCYWRPRAKAAAAAVDTIDEAAPQERS